MSNCQSNYPDELPLGCIQQLITITRAGEIASRAKEFASAAWMVTGYCLKTFVGEPSPVINGVPPSPPLSAEARQQVIELEGLLSASGAEPAGSQLSVFLHNFVLPVLVAALKKLLEAVSE